MLLCQNYQGEPCSTRSSCDIIVIPIQEPKALFLVMRPNPSYLSLVLFLLPQDGWTALICASQDGHISVVEKLLAAGANPNYQVRNLVTRVMLIHVLKAFFPDKDNLVWVNVH